MNSDYSQKIDEIFLSKNCFYCVYFTYINPAYMFVRKSASNVPEADIADNLYSHSCLSHQSETILTDI